MKKCHLLHADNPVRWICTSINRSQARSVFMSFRFNNLAYYCKKTSVHNNWCTLIKQLRQLINTTESKRTYHVIKVPMHIDGVAPHHCHKAFQHVHKQLLLEGSRLPGCSGLSVHTATKKRQDTCQPLPPNGKNKPVQDLHLLINLNLEFTRARDAISLCGRPYS